MNVAKVTVMKILSIKFQQLQIRKYPQREYDPRKQRGRLSEEPQCTPNIGVRADVSHGVVASPKTPNNSGCAVDIVSTVT